MGSCKACLIKMMTLLIEGLSNLSLRKSRRLLTFAPRLQLTGITIFSKTKNREMSNYELMVIFTPVLSEEEYKTAQKKYEALVKDNGGEVTHTNPWGLKSLAYPVQKKTTGLYWVTEFKALSDFNEKLKIQLLRDDNVMRHMVTKLDKHAVEYNARKISGVKHFTLPEKTEA